MASYRFYIPNVSEFFEGLLSLLQHCGDCVKETTDGGHAEFVSRRQEEYQRTLCDLWVMYGHREPTQSVSVADCYFKVNVLDLPFASPIAIYR